MKLWTEPLWPRVRTWLLRNRELLFDLQTLSLASYISGIVGLWAFGGGSK
jgi:hypothetical protein